MRALEAANEEHCNAHRNQDGKNTSVHREPMSKMLHLRFHSLGPGRAWVNLYKSTIRSIYFDGLPTQRLTTGDPLVMR
jgi:hypothetical protein